MINIQTEQVVSFSQARQHLPQRRKGKRPHPSTLHRWATRGIHGVVLECIQIAGTKCTSVEALQRFFEELTVASNRRSGRAVSIPTTTQQMDINRQLDAEGF